MLAVPPRDPTVLFELFRGNYATELLTAAITPLDVFARLARGPRTFEEWRGNLGLAERPAHVLLTALRAFGLIAVQDTRLTLTPLALDHLVPGRPSDVSAYMGLAADSPGVREMVERLRTNQPAGGQADRPGAAFIFREGRESAIEEKASARHLTLALAGRARNVAPVLAERYPLDEARLLLDVGGGSGLYSIAWLQRHPYLRAIVWDRPEVLKVAREMAQQGAVLSFVLDDQRQMRCAHPVFRPGAIGPEENGEGIGPHRLDEDGSVGHLVEFWRVHDLRDSVNIHPPRSQKRDLGHPGLNLRSKK
jgi:hypothetical protein